MSRTALALLVMLATAGSAMAEGDVPEWVPHRRHAVVTQTTITMLDTLRFSPGSAAIDPATAPILDAIAETLEGNPSLQLVEVHAFAPDVLPGLRWITAQLRARNVVANLVAHGVAPERLRSRGLPTAPAGPHVVFELEIVTRTP